MTLLNTPEVRNLIDRFSREIVDVTREVVLNDLEAAFQGQADRISASRSKPRRVTRPKRPARVARPVRVQKDVQTNKAKQPYLPKVSSEILNRILPGLSSEKLTSTELANKLGIGETTVRVALKHLVNERAAIRTVEGRQVLYATA